MHKLAHRGVKWLGPNQIRCYIYCMKDVPEQPVRRGPGRPPTGKTPTRSLRMGTVWDQARSVAVVRGETITEVIEAALGRYVARNRHLLGAKGAETA